MIRHVVMWKVLGSTPAERQSSIDRVSLGFLALRGLIPGMTRLEIGVDVSRVDYACDLVLISELESPEALAAYAHHPEHMRLKDALTGLRTERHQVDFSVTATDDER